MEKRTSVKGVNILKAVPCCMDSLMNENITIEIENFDIKTIVSIQQ